uniref:ATP-dependent RNA helicase n=1 Tax=Micromonas pusilla TaxID=38833 RepID=A0A7S0KT76_MICPS
MAGAVAKGAEGGSEPPKQRTAEGPRFSSLTPPLRPESLEVLAAQGFERATPVQAAAIGLLAGNKDVAVEACTGSGKTLAFIVPTLEALYRAKWGRQDGIGGLIIAPTRELATQIFQQLVAAGKHHSLSAGLLIGGKNVKEEKDTVNRMNLLVCTPGRLLQHMDETPMFDCVSLKVLVLDEADRILDLGFRETLAAILENLPKKGRQTLLFSATQTKSVKDLARLSMRDPEYLAVHAESAHATPPKLSQMVATCELDKKMETMWAFIKSHLTSKTLVFLSSCKQVRFVHEMFRRMRPGIPVAMLHGRMKQMKRMATFDAFCKAKHTVLFATDVAARGLDFPSVDWVLQADCPEDVPCYIHRVGRTARYTAEGKGLLLLTPSESAFAKELAAAKVPLKTMKLNQAKNQKITSSIQGLLGKDTELKYLAQRAVVSYLRSIYLQPNKDVFDVNALDVDAYAHSMGLPNPPRLRFLKSQKGAGKNGKKEEDSDDSEGDDSESEEAPARAEPPRAKARDDDDSDSDEDDSDEDDSDEEHDKTKSAGVLKRVGGGHFGMKVDDADSDDDLMTVKRADHRLDDAADYDDDDGDDSRDDDGERHLSERAKAVLAEGPVDLAERMRQKAKKGKLRIKQGGHGANERVVFGEDGEAMAPLEALGVKSRSDGPVPDGGEELAAAAKAHYDKIRAERLRADKADRLREKERLRDIRNKERVKRRKADGLTQSDSDGDSDEEAGARLGGASDSDGSESESESEEPGKRRKVDVAVAGMAAKDETVESMEERALRLLRGK